MTDVLLLALDASTYVGSVAVIHGDHMLAHREVAMRGEHTERLMPAVAATLVDAGVALRDIGGVACGAGPGSFTSLRIAASIAKGIAAGRNKPLLAVSSLLLMVAATERATAPGTYVAVLDALRGQVFAGVYEQRGGGQIEEVVSTSLVDEAALHELVGRLRARIVGPGREIEGIPHARGFRPLARMLAKAHPVDLAQWEPDYGRAAEAQVRWEAAHGRPLPRG